MMLSLIFCISCWSLYYTLLRIVSKTSISEWNSHVVSFTHAILVVQATGYYLFKWPLPIEEFDQENTSYHINVIYFVPSHYIFDTCRGVYMQTERFVMVMHHFVIMGILSASLYLERYGYGCILILFVGELTNPMLQIRWFLRSKELHRTTFPFVNEALFVMLFIILRMFFGSYIVYVALLSGVNIPLKCLGIALHIVNCSFMYEIFTLVKKRFC